MRAHVSLLITLLAPAALTAMADGAPARTLLFTRAG